MSYATPAELTARYAVQTIGQLASDSSSALDQTGINASSIVQAALDDASGQIEAALLRGQRYAVTDLQGLTGNSLSLLKRINCDGAFIFLYERKSWDGQDQRLDKALENFERMLKRLATGEDVFNVPAVLTAGLPEITGPTSLEYNQLNTIASRARGHMLPGVRLPFDR